MKQNGKKKKGGDVVDDQGVIIPSDFAKNALKMNANNIAMKLKSGKTLTASEHEQLVDAMSVGGRVTGAQWVGNQQELAEELGCSRASIRNWMRFPDRPKQKTSGEYDVQAWRDYVKRKNLRCEATVDEATALRLRKMKAEAEDREIRVALRKGELYHAAFVHEQMNITFGRLKTMAQKMFCDELPPLLVGKTAHEIRKIHEDGLMRLWTQMSKSALTQR